jgi:hypothetical protein
MLLEQKYLYPVSGVCTASVIQLDHTPVWWELYSSTQYSATKCIRRKLNFKFDSLPSSEERHDV